jgi:hypothetical protein
MKLRRKELADLAKIKSDTLSKDLVGLSNLIYGAAISLYTAGFMYFFQSGKFETSHIQRYLATNPWAPEWTPIFVVTLILTAIATKIRVVASKT